MNWAEPSAWGATVVMSLGSPIAASLALSAAADWRASSPAAPLTVLDSPWIS
jgi:hypothetical protein